MDYLQPVFEAVTVIFSLSAVYTGIQALVDPIGFSKFFGLPLAPTTTTFAGESRGNETPRKSKFTTNSFIEHDLAKSYVSLMGVRQLATGLILLTFACQAKWTEAATILAIIGVLVAGTDGVYLSKSGSKKLGQFHAIPGILIAALAASTLYTSV